MDKMPPRIIAIVGTPGSGKSFLVQKLAEYYQAEAFLEGEEENFPKFILEYFKDTYSNLRIIKWFRNKLIKEIKEAQKAAQQGKMVILDTFWLSNECYLSIMGNNKERLEAAELCSQDRKNLPFPDLIIYLKASERLIRKFMEQRKRSFENERAVHQALEIEKEHERIFTQKDFKNLIIFPRESLDFNKKEDLSQITRIIDSS